MFSAGALRRLRGKFPKLGALMDEAENDVLAFMTLPRAHWTQIYSTNPLERLNAEIKRRTNVVGIFPNDASIVRLVGATMLEQNDKWSLNRRYMQLEGLHSLRCRSHSAVRCGSLSTAHLSSPGLWTYTITRDTTTANHGPCGIRTRIQRANRPKLRLELPT